MQSSPVSPHSTPPPHSAQRASTFWLLIPLWFQLSQPISLQDKDSFGLHGSRWASASLHLAPVSGSQLRKHSALEGRHF